MKKKLFIPLFLFLSVGWISAQVKLDVSEDTYIWSNTTDLGDETTAVRGADEILVSYFNESKLYRRMIFLKFNLANAPQKSDINSVKLRMYGVADAGGGINTTTGETTALTHSLGVYNMNGAEKGGTTLWSETSFSYNGWVTNYDYSRKPNFLAGKLDDVTGEGWLEWDITSEMMNYVLGLDNILTLNVCDEYIMKIPTDPADNTNSYVTFHSKENPSGNKPHLVFVTKNSGIDSDKTQKEINYRLIDKELTVSDISFGTKVKITDLSGKTVYASNPNGSLNYSFTNNGVYILTL
ncbi:MAG: DNRLRE domain-containing protein [Dysgonomonas sp.]